MNDHVKLIRYFLIQAAVGFCVKQAGRAMTVVWQNKVAQLRAERQDTLLDSAKTQLTKFLFPYVRFKNDNYNSLDIITACQCNKIPIPETQIKDLLFVVSAIDKHDEFGYGYYFIPKPLTKKIEDVLSYLEALERQQQIGD